MQRQFPTLTRTSQDWSHGCWNWGEYCHSGLVARVGVSLSHLYILKECNSWPLNFFYLLVGCRDNSTWIGCCGLSKTITKSKYFIACQITTVWWHGYVLIALTSLSLSDSSTITEENRQFLALSISPGHFWHQKFHLIMVYQLTHFVKFLLKGFCTPILSEQLDNSSFSR